MIHAADPGMHTTPGKPEYGDRAMRNLSEHTITDAVIARLVDTPDPRIRQIMTSLVRHLHAFAREVRLTEAEWMRGIEFLTATGRMCTDTRQEFILLSDTLGLSMLTVMMGNDKPPGCTEATVFGPFHVEGAPERAFGASIADDDYGAPPVVFAGTVTSSTGTPLVGARLDVWQAAPNLCYDVQDPEMPAMNYRGVFHADERGAYEFVTTRPPAYQIPGDGPAGAMLRAMNRHNWRPGHTHVVVEAQGHKTVITHVFDASSDYLDSDAVFGVRDSLVVDMSGPRIMFDFVLEPLDS